MHLFKEYIFSVNAVKIMKDSCSQYDKGFKQWVAQQLNIQLQLELVGINRVYRVIMISDVRS